MTRSPLIAGKRRTISTSKIKKIIVIKKNRKEKGRRVEEFESNPHSKGEVFSRLNFILLDKISETTINKLVIRKIVNPIISKR